MTRATCGCRVGGWSGHLTVNGTCSDFPGVDHEGRQACAVLILLFIFVLRKNAIKPEME